MQIGNFNFLKEVDDLISLRKSAIIKLQKKKRTREYKMIYSVMNFSVFLWHIVIQQVVYYCRTTAT